MIAILIALLISFLTGWGLIQSAMPRTGRPIPEQLMKFGLALAVGLGIGSGNYIVWRFFFGMVAHGYLILDLILLAAAWILRFRLEPPAQPDDTSGRLPRWTWALVAALLVVGGVKVVSAVTGAIRTASGVWDAWAIWNLRARFLFRGNEHWGDAFSPSLAWSHPDYPLMLPGSVARLWTYAGADSRLAPMLLTLAFTLITALVLIGGLWTLRGRLHAALGGLLLLSTPFYLQMGVAQISDLPLACYALVTLVLLCLSETSARPRSLLMLAGLTAGMAAWTKNEGLLFLVALAAAWVLVGLYRREWTLEWRRLPSLALGLLPFMLLVVYFKLNLAPPNDIMEPQGGASTLAKLLDPERYRIIFREYGHQYLHWGQGAMVILTAFLLLMGLKSPFRANRAQQVGLVGLVLSFAGYFAIYAITPRDLYWHLISSLDRLLLHMWPSALLIGFLLVREQPLPWAAEGRAITRAEAPEAAEIRP